MHTLRDGFELYFLYGVPGELVPGFVCCACIAKYTHTTMVSSCISCMQYLASLCWLCMLCMQCEVYAYNYGFELYFLYAARGEPVPGLLVDNVWCEGDAQSNLTLMCPSCMQYEASLFLVYFWTMSGVKGTRTVI